MASMASRSSPMAWATRGRRKEAMAISTSTTSATMLTLLWIRRSKDVRQKPSPARPRAAPRGGPRSAGARPPRSRSRAPLLAQPARDGGDS